MNEQLLNLAIQEAPAVIGLLKGLFSSTHPADPVPTDDEVIAAYQSAFESSIAKDDRWLASHPPRPSV